MKVSWALRNCFMLKTYRLDNYRQLVIFNYIILLLKEYMGVFGKT